MLHRTIIAQMFKNIRNFEMAFTILINTKKTLHPNLFLPTRVHDPVKIYLRRTSEIYTNFLVIFTILIIICTKYVNLGSNFYMNPIEQTTLYFYIL